jgi:hypothetical protein
MKLVRQESLNKSLAKSRKSQAEKSTVLNSGKDNGGSVVGIAQLQKERQLKV